MEDEMRTLLESSGGQSIVETVLLIPLLLILLAGGYWSFRNLSRPAPRNRPPTRIF